MKNNHKAIVFLAISTLALPAEPIINSPDEAVEHITCFLTDTQYQVVSFREMCLKLAQELTRSSDPTLVKLGHTFAQIAHETDEVKIMQALKGYQDYFKKKGYKILDFSTLRKRLAASLKHR